MNATTSTTNEDLLEVMQDMMQTTSNGFAQTNAKLDEHSKILNEHSRALAEHGEILAEHGRILAAHSRELKDIRREVGAIQASVDKLSNEHAVYVNDISDILDRIIVLEKQERLSKTERQELQRLLQTVANWVSEASKALGIPIKLPS